MFQHGHSGVITRAATVALVAILVALGAGRTGAEDSTGTFSIVAYDSVTQELGVAVQSRAFSVGTRVPWAEAGVGAIATQAWTNSSFGPHGLALLRSGHTASEVLATLLSTDPGREKRQVGIVDASGRTAAHTGTECSAWAGDSTLTGVTAQGNILAGAAVVSEMLRAFAATPGELSEKLMAALHAAQAAGGDRRGQQSAALLVVRPSDQYPEYRTRYVDLRVEDHTAPITELERVFRINQAGNLLRAHLRYAAYYDSLGNTAAAELEDQRVEATLQRVIADPDAKAGALNGVAWYCASAGSHLDAAARAAERAVSLEPENTSFLDTLAEVQYRSGQRDAAVTTIEKALRLAPDDAALRAQLERMKQPAPSGSR
jgi:uncharacterized Ntn-hydrolase superfamily protein